MQQQSNCRNIRVIIKNARMNAAANEKVMAAASAYINISGYGAWKTRIDALVFDLRD